MGAALKNARPSFDRDTVLNALTGRFADFYGQFTGLKPSGGELRGPCPLHDGHGPNFSVQPETGAWFCHSQCQEGGDVFAFVQQRENLDFPAALARVASIAGIPAAPPPVTLSRRVASYDYTDADGTLLFQVTRFEPKTFRQRRPDGGGGWIANLDGVTRVLYRLPFVQKQVAGGKTVFVVEGEKDADALSALGVCATTAPGGADKWQESFSDSLRGASVVLLPDNDWRGHAHMETVARSLHGKAKRIQVLTLPNLPEKGDVSDWLAAGGTLEALRALVNDAPDWTPPAAPVPAVVLPSLSSMPSWPERRDAAFYGLAGEIVRLIEPHSEADPVALLVQFLVAFGNAIGRTAHFRAEADRHCGNLFAVMVGQSSKGRKGTSWGHIERRFSVIEPLWAGRRILAGLSSGEGLIFHVRDAVEKQVKDKKSGEMETVVVDAGEEDKRMMLVESEFASVLKQTQREGNTLSAIVRQAWDKGRLNVLTKNNPLQATDVHISIVGHITQEELLRTLSTTEAGNGFANRFLWVCTKRSKSLPEGGDIETVDFGDVDFRLKNVISHARQTTFMERDAEARALWAKEYARLSSGGLGLFGAVTGRAEAQTMRLALLFALLDGADCIGVQPLRAALALWDYCEASARFLFGDSLGDPLADELLKTLRDNSQGLTRTEIRDHFGRHQQRARVERALETLRAQGLVRFEMRETGGRAAEVWRIV